MLMQSFKAAADLGITEEQRSALMKTLVLLETEQLSHADPDYRSDPKAKLTFTGHFNMAWWSLPAGCGTICCIGGTAEFVGGLREDELNDATDDNPELFNLFYPGKHRPCGVKMRDIVPAQAATALRSYLTTGNARWDMAVQP